jgi:hypothetical protein
MVRRVARVIAMLALVAGASAARADQPAQTAQEIVELRYDAPAECPPRSELEAAILERTPNVRIGAPAHRVFAVTIAATPDGFRGTLIVDRVADKELAAQRCDDLANALALVTALAIDPTATAAPTTVRPLAAAASTAHAPPTPAPRAPTSLAADVGAIVVAGVSPSALFAVALEGHVIWRERYQLEVAALAGRDTSAREDAQVRFTWLAGRLAGCRHGPHRRVTADACGHVEVGAVRASGEDIINQRDLTRLWLAAGAHGRVRIPVGARGFGLLQLGASLPLVRDRYIFAPDVAIHTTPVVTVWAGVGFGFTFR